MPIYEYECLSCGERFELRQNMTDDISKTRCPKCGAEHPRRVLSTFTKGASNKSCAPSKPT